MGVIIEKQSSHWDRLKDKGINVKEPSALHDLNTDVTRLLVVNPMPEARDAHEITENMVLRHLASHADERDVAVDVIRVRVDVPDVDVDEAPRAQYSVDPDAYARVKDLLDGGNYHGVQLLGASSDHVPFENVHDRHLVTDIIDAAIDTDTSLLTVCNGSFEYLNHVHGIEKQVNKAEGADGVNPKLEKIIGHFQNQVEPQGIADSADVKNLKDALSLAPVMPTGRVGYMEDRGIQTLVESGDLQVLARSVDMDSRPDAQIAAVFDAARNAVCVAPHFLDYGPRAIISEAERDHATPQGNTVTPPIEDIPNLYLHGYDTDGGTAPWHEAADKFYQVWVDAINPPSAQQAKPANDAVIPFDNGAALG